MKKVKYLIWFLSGVFLLLSCTQELLEIRDADDNEDGIRIVLSPESIGLVETKTATPDMEPADSRIDHVIIYAFNSDGSELLARYQQDLEYPDNEVRMILPSDKGDLQIHAVCNYARLWDKNIETTDDLDKEIIIIDQADAAFSGGMIMHGKLQDNLTQDDVQNKQKTIQIYVSRIAAMIDFTLKFDPENSEDKFYLGDVRVYNIPKRSYLVKRPQLSPTDQGDDASYNADAETALANNYFDNMLLQTSGDDAAGYKGQFYMFENRCGAEDDDEYYKKYQENTEMYQTMKGEIGRSRHKLATYIRISGTYISSNDVNSNTISAIYDIYLGHDNYKDFNVTRNCRYDVTATIKTCNDLDTRVTAENLDSAKITGAFNNPLDAHFNVVRCFGYTVNDGGWELYVENPDEHPWLEISLSSQYRPNIPGNTYYDSEGNVLDESMVASSRIKGEGAMSGYFYIHTDEFVPENPSANESLNNTTDPSSWRTGVVVLRDLTNKTEARIEVTQRPAQAVKMTVYDLLGRPESENKYFVEYELEQKNITWGFLMYGANPVMTSMINDRWDGLSNTRKLYQEAVKVPEDPDDESEDSGIYWGAYNGYYTVEDTYPRSTDMAEVVGRIPDDHMIKYVLSKNRDRNGNGYIDYDEIVWYVPALDELAELYSAMNDAGRRNVFFQNDESRFHSSTPYLAGYTAEVPGRAFYVKMDSGETAFAMRDRQYNVICCRRVGAWRGNEDAGFGAGVTENDDWNEDEDIIPKRESGGLSGAE